MHAFIRALRFFHVLELSHPLMTGGIALATVAALVTVAIDPVRALPMAVPLLLLQMLGSSSGFAPSARRGHYDLPLTTGLGRWQIGVAHWCMSIWPGLAAWTAIVVAESLRAPRSVELLRPGPIAALILASTLPWAITVPFPRLTGGLSLVVAIASLSVVVPPGAPDGWVRQMRQLGAEAPAAAVVLAAIAMLLALRFIRKMDVPLETAQ